MYSSFASLGHISARFAAQLAVAGALTALMSLEAQLRAHCGQAAGCGAGAGAGDGAAPPNEAAAECFSVYVPHVPPVRHRSQSCWEHRCTMRVMNIWLEVGLSNCGKSSTAVQSCIVCV